MGVAMAAAYRYGRLRSDYILGSLGKPLHVGVEREVETRGGEGVSPLTNVM